MSLALTAAPMHTEITHDGRTCQIAQEELLKIRIRTNRLFAGLMAVQLAAVIISALILTPRTWVGDHHAIHVHVIAAIVMGSLIAALPIALVLRQPERYSTQIVVSISQTLFSALFIYISGGRIETHFHAFASLAFLAFYRDWKTLLPATAILSIDHLIRGVFWPQWIFGAATASPWRAFEHIGWFVLEDIILAYSCVTSANNLKMLGSRQSELEATNAQFEAQILVRTEELRNAMTHLEQEMEDRRTLESQLVQAQKLESIGQLAAGIAHEINTPAQYVGDNTRFLRNEFESLLRVIDHYSSQLDASAPASDWQERQTAIRGVLDEVDYDFLRTEVPQALSQSLEGIERITQIVKAMKDFSHPGSDHKEPADINKAIESTTTVCANRWKYIADLELNLDPTMPPVPCLLGEFNQVILNIVVNAADAIDALRTGTEQRGLIRIETSHDDGHAEIRISDNGGGMPESVRQKIFDPFFTTKEVGKGTGQGLSICRDVVARKHQGEIHCESQQGVGTTFRIRLPLQNTSQQQEAA